MSDNSANTVNDARKSTNFKKFRFTNRFNAYNRSTEPRIRPISMQISSNQINRSSMSSPLSSDNQANVEEPTSYRINANQKCDYLGWKLYFPEEEYNAHSKIVRRVQAFETHIKRNPLCYKLNHIQHNLWFPVTIDRVENDTEFIDKWPSFNIDLSESTEEVLMIMVLAIHQRIIKDLPSISTSQLSGIETTSKFSLLTIRARIVGHSPVVSLQSLRQNNYGKLISVRGTVIRRNEVELVTSWMAYKCAQCHSEQAIRQIDRSKLIVPASCKGDGCRSRSNFRPLLHSPFTRTEPYQTIRLQESMQSSQYDGSGRIPKSVDVELAFDLVDTVCPGDDITLTGIIKVRSQQDNSRSMGSASLHQFYIQGISIVSNKNTVNISNSEFSENDMEMIEKIKTESNPFYLFVHSLCPPVFSHEMVKAGLVLALFGGSGNGENGDRTPGVGRRSETHVLIVGDPGLGKSLLLQSCANVSPRGIFVCGNSTSNAGLTVSVRHEKGTGNTMEAGALVLADQGVCCIDEFDKMSAKYQSLLQAMEQQTVSVAKAGVLCSLPARTCILSAANPAGGHYNKGKTVSENLKMCPTILSRFDFAFILLDRADSHLDDLLTAHIQALHGKQSSSPNSSRQTASSSQSTSNNFRFGSKNQSVSADIPLFERLKIEKPADFTPISQEMMQKYIGYARKHCYPLLSSKAAEEIKKFYLELRKTSHGIDSIPVTTRQLEALIRLSQARARVDLSGVVTLEHVKDVLAIFRYTLIDVLRNDEDALQMKRNINGAGMSQATQVKKYLQLLQQQDKTIFTFDDLKDIAVRCGLNRNLGNIIDSLNVQGFLIKKGRDLYKFMN